MERAGIRHLLAATMVSTVIGLLAWSCGPGVPKDASVQRGIVFLDTAALKARNIAVKPLLLAPWCCNLPAATDRIVSASGSIEIVDDEWFSDNERQTVPFSNTIHLTAGQSATLIQSTGCAGDEVFVKLRIDAARGVGNDVSIQGTAELFEDSGCPNTELEGTTNFAFTVPAGSSVPNYSIYVSNGADYAEIKLTVSNLP